MAEYSTLFGQKPPILDPGEWDSVRISRLRDEIRSIPGVTLLTGVKCAVVRPEAPDVPNIHMTECYHLLNHEGPHSWERSFGGE